MIAYKEIKRFPQEQIAELFASVEWETPEDTGMLVRALANSTRVISAWDGERLVGIIRSMDDDFWSANIDCLIVHRDYWGQGIGSSLVKRLSERLRHVKYVSVSPSERENIGFYEKLGFIAVEGSALLQITNY